MYRDRRFTILHIIKIFTTDDFTTDFYNVNIFVYWRTIFKHLSNNQHRIVPLKTIEDGKVGLQKGKITHLIMKVALLCNE